MKKISAIIISFIMVFTSVFALPLTACAAQTFPTDVEAPSSSCVFLGIKGKYVVDIENALKRINEIRKEACKEGIINPSTGEPLTTADYVPIKWSSDLEYIARIRAAEASITMDHTRTNLQSCFNISSPNGVRSYGEVIAWNFSESVIMGINQWYGEKYDWANNTGGVTGHYTQMIDPQNTYVGLGTFCSESAYYYNTTCGQYSSYSSLDETRGTAVNDCIQVLEVEKSLLTGKYEISGASNLQVGKTAKYNLLTSVKVTDYWGDENVTSGLYVLSDVKWSTSDSSIATMNNNVININKCGSVSVIAKDYSGKTVKKTVTIPHSFDKIASKATLTKDGEMKCSLCNQVQKINKIGEIKLSATEYTYNGKVRKPGVTVKDSKGNTISSDNYKVSYADGRKNVGKYSVKITFKGNYSGSKTLNFTINPTSTTLSSVSASSKGFTAKWKKKTSAVTGYEIQYSTDSKFKKNNKTVTVSKNSTTSKKIKSLKANKKYYVRVRTYKNVGKTKYVSSWSKSKSVVTKK